MVGCKCYYVFILGNSTLNFTVQFNAKYYPVWASLSCDYLAIMASSVSSERAFSQGGITISKRRNRLKGDVVEALQCLKCSLRHDLLFREAGSSLALEPEVSDVESGLDEPDLDVNEIESWDIILDDDSDT